MAELRIAGVVDDSITDGEGLRFTIFTQGCPHLCKGCHNPETHDFDGGKIVDTNNLFEEISKNVLLSGVTFSGGEPICQVRAILDLARRIRRETELNITLFTGYTLAELRDMHDGDVDELLALTYMIVDGKYIERERDLTLNFRGSRNQNITYFHINK